MKLRNKAKVLDARKKDNKSVAVEQKDTLETNTQLPSNVEHQIRSKPQGWYSQPEKQWLGNVKATGVVVSPRALFQP
jgi:hypothetical protein